MKDKPVLYLDLDDTLISWEGGSPHSAPGARDFLIWALSRFEVRWLTTWCPSGEMDEKLLRDLAHLLDLPVEKLRDIRGLEWNREGSKLNGVAWLEHIVLGRTFVWIEDGYGFTPLEHAFLAMHGLASCYRHCNVTADARSLGLAHAALRRRFDGLHDAA